MYHYAPALIDRGHIILACPFVCPSICSFVCPQKLLTLTLAFEWLVIELSHFTYVFFGVKPFLWYQSQGHPSRSNIKVIVSKKMALAGALVFYKHSMIFNFSEGFLPIQIQSCYLSHILIWHLQTGKT